MAFEFGDVVLVPFPFTSQASAKRRPAVVVSTRAYNGARPDVVLMAVSSQVRTPLGFGELFLNDWSHAGLPKPSLVKPIFATFEQRLVIKTLGALAPIDQSALSANMRSLLG
jgi:mRNA interferase MazF